MMIFVIHCLKFKELIKFKTNLSAIAWFKVGGPAKVLFKPKNLEDLVFFLKNKPNNLKIFPMGAASNLIIRDGGLDSAVIKLGKAFAKIEFSTDFVDVGAACLDQYLSKTAIAQGAAGLEFLSGIPGTIGGAIRMNAGCYGCEIKDILEFAIAVDNEGNIHKLSANDLNLSYRKCRIEDDWIFVKARLRTAKALPLQIKKTVDTMMAKRNASQPTKGATGGCTFANPQLAADKNNNRQNDVDYSKAWSLIKAVNGHKLKIGDASFSDLHSNFMINNGNACANDLETLGNTVKQRILDKFGIDLKWEIKIIGKSK